MNVVRALQYTLKIMAGTRLPAESTQFECLYLACDVTNSIFVKKNYKKIADDIGLSFFGISVVTA